MRSASGEREWCEEGGRGLVRGSGVLRGQEGGHE